MYYCVLFGYGKIYSGTRYLLIPSLIPRKTFCNGPETRFVSGRNRINTYTPRCVISYTKYITTEMNNSRCLNCDVFTITDNFWPQNVTCSGTGDAVRFVNTFYYDFISRHYKFLLQCALFTSVLILYLGWSSDYWLLGCCYNLTHLISSWRCVSDWFLLISWFLFLTSLK
jgi:hypothetical protein